MAVPRIQYIGGETVLHRLHPLSKLLVLALLSVSAFMFSQWYVAGSIALILILLHLLKGVGIGRLLHVLKALPPFILLIVLAHILLIRSNASLLTNALVGLLQSLRIADLLVAAGLFLLVTDPVDLSDSVIRVVRPLERVGVRVEEISLMMMITFSFLPLITLEADRLQTAQSVRCGFGGRGLGVISRIIPFIAPLVVGIFRRAEEMELSLAARCYSLQRSRSSSAQPWMGRADLIICTASVFLFVALVYAKIKNNS